MKPRSYHVSGRFARSGPRTSAILVSERDLPSRHLLLLS
jgi:hypothetical protein